MFNYYIKNISIIILYNKIYLIIKGPAGTGKTESVKALGNVIMIYYLILF